MSKKAEAPEFPLLPEDEEQLDVKTARKEGRQVVTMRIVSRGGSYHVECEVYPVSGLRVDPLQSGPYTFATADEATGFMDEAARALSHLGCEVD
jgi:hypothetical protein